LRDRFIRLQADFTNFRNRVQRERAELYRRAIDKGMHAVHHCLMGPTTPPQRWDHGHGRVTREYAMYERGIGE